LYKERDTIIKNHLKAKGVQAEINLHTLELVDKSFIDFIIKAFYELYPAISYSGRITYNDIYIYFQIQGLKDMDEFNIYLNCIRKLELVYDKYLSEQKARAVVTTGNTHA
tara:strand:+ start:10908 stop:11237 length:330 start_codon:yes stop_codon:yes gene_type:complete